MNVPVSRRTDPLATLDALIAECAPDPQAQYRLARLRQLRASVYALYDDRQRLASFVLALQDHLSPATGAVARRLLEQLDYPGGSVQEMDGGREEGREVEAEPQQQLQGQGSQQAGQHRL